MTINYTITGIFSCTFLFLFVCDIFFKCLLMMLSMVENFLFLTYLLINQVSLKVSILLQKFFHQFVFVIELGKGLRTRKHVSVKNILKKVRGIGLYYNNFLLLFQVKLNYFFSLRELLVLILTF